MKSLQKKTIIITLFFFLATIITVAQSTYTYTGTGDWTNTANWLSTYPGTSINVNDEVIIDGSMTLDVSVTVYGAFVINANKTVEISDGFALTAANDGYIVNNGIINNDGFISLAGSSPTAEGNLYNYGTLTNSGSISTGFLSILQNNHILINNGNINLSGPEHRFINIGTLAGNNVNHSGDTEIKFGSNINPGTDVSNSIGIYTFNNNLIFDDNTPSINIELESNTSFDKLAITNTATLNGTLNVSLINGFTPSIGDEFTILTASTVSGTFTTTNLPADYIWNITYNASNVVLEVSNTLSVLDFKISQFKLFPNPTDNEFTIELGSSILLQKVNIYNNIGQLVLSGIETRIKTSGLANGIYIVEITSTEGLKTSKKLVID